MPDTAGPASKCLSCRGVALVLLRFVDDSAALVAGRELLGYPKKMAEIEFRKEGSTIHCEASRNGKRVLAMAAELEEEQERIPFLGRRHLNVQGNVGLLPAKLITFRPHEIPVTVHRARVELSLFGESLHDDLYTLALQEFAGRTIQAFAKGFF